MRNRFLLLLNLALITNVMFAQQSQQTVEDWVAKKDGHGEWDNTNDLQVTASGDVYITGYSQKNSGQDYDAITTKYDTQGNEIWSAELDAGQYTYVRALDVANDGSVVLTGQYYDGSNYNNQKMITAKYSSNGTLLWTATLSATANYNYYSYAYGMDVKVDANGNVTAFGYGYDNNTWGHFLVKYDASGTEVWRNFTPHSNAYMQKMGIDAAGNCYLMGYKYNYNYSNYNYHDIWVQKFNSSGVIQWDNVYDRNYNEYTTDAVVTAAGDVYIAAHQYQYNSNNYSYNFLTLKIGSNGTLVWDDALTFNQNYSYPQALDVAPNGNVAVVGYVSNNNGYYGYSTVTYDANGTNLWTATAQGSMNYDYAMDVAMGNNGDVFVTGYSYNQNVGVQTGLTVKYDGSTGAEQWYARYGDDTQNGQNNSYHYAYGQFIDVDAANSAYVGMYDYSYDYNNYNYNQSDYTTVKYAGNLASQPLSITETTVSNYAGYGVTCNGGNDGTIDVAINGGTAPFTYIVNGQATSNPIVGLTAGTYTVVVTDALGQTAQTTAVITEPQPFAVAQNITVALDVNGNATITAAQVDNGSSTACGLSLSVSPASFNCSNVGANTVTLSSIGANGSVATATATVTVLDAIAPVAIAQDVTVQLDASGNGSISAEQVDNGSNDACGVTLAVSPSVFTCANVGSSNPVTLTVTDANGNISTVTANVIVIDAVAPVAICQNVTANLVNGTVSITVEQVNNGSNDACGIASMTVAPSTFNCDNIGANPVTLTVTDVNGNVSTCDAIVDVIGVQPTCAITSVPTSTVFTGGNPNELYLGYGAQSTTLATTVTGGGTFTYAWTGQNLNSTTSANPVFTPTTAGNYSFKVIVTSASGCVTSCTIDICVYDIRVPGTNGKKVFICHVPEGNPSNANTLSVSVSAVPSHIGLHGGDRLGECNMVRCTPVLRSMEVEEGHDHVESLILSVYPNPNNGIFSIKSNMAGTYTLINELGQEVRVFELNEANNFSVNVTDLVDGMYFVYGVNNNEIVREKIVITK